jgi:hypothetical protein
MVPSPNLHVGGYLFGSIYSGYYANNLVTKELHCARVTIY